VAVALPDQVPKPSTTTQPRKDFTMSKITLFQNTNFGGDHLSLQQPDANLKNQNFNDKTSAIIVCSGNWKLYQDSNFNGKLWEVHEKGGPNQDGLYPSYKDWGGTNDSISSLIPA
jgi:hypothetical protein